MKHAVLNEEVHYHIKRFNALYVSVFLMPIVVAIIGIVAAIIHFLF